MAAIETGTVGNAAIGTGETDVTGTRATGVAGPLEMTEAETVAGAGIEARTEETTVAGVVVEIKVTTEGPIAAGGEAVTEMAVDPPVS